MKIAIDTNAYCLAARNEPRVIALLRSAQQIFLPFVVLAELRAGFAAGSARSRNEANLVSFLRSPRVTLLFADEQTTHHYARIFAQLKAQGTPIPTNDIWIAAIAVQHDLALLTNDVHFSYLPQLARA